MAKEKVSNAFDLGELEKQSEDTAWLTILHPVTGVETNMRILVASPDSAEYRKVNNRLRDKTLKDMARGRNAKQRTAEKIDAEGLDMLTDVTLGWEGVVKNGEAIPFSRENVRSLYESFPAIREQVDEFLADRRNFFKE